jgi:hypothetical protein
MALFGTKWHGLRRPPLPISNGASDLGQTKKGVDTLAFAVPGMRGLLEGPPRRRLAPTRGSQPWAQSGRRPEWAREKMAENDGFSGGKSANFPCLEPGTLNTTYRFGRFYVGRCFWRPRARKMSGAIFGQGPCRRDVQRPCKPRRHES